MVVEGSIECIKKGNETREWMRRVGEVICERVERVCALLIQHWSTGLIINLWDFTSNLGEGTCRSLRSPAPSSVKVRR